MLYKLPSKFRFSWTNSIWVIALKSDPIWWKIQLKKTALEKSLYSYPPTTVPANTFLDNWANQRWEGFLPLTPRWNFRAIHLHTKSSNFWVKLQREYCLYLFWTMRKIKKTTKARSKTSEAGRAGRRNSSRESVAVSNEHRNFKEEMLAAMAATYTSTGCQRPVSQKGEFYFRSKRKTVFSPPLFYIFQYFFFYMKDHA